MSTKRITVAGGTLLALGFFAGSLEGCGSSASDNKALCKRFCDKTSMCIPEFAPFLATCEQQCAMQTGTSGQPCKNQSTIIAKLNECLAKPCADKAYENCIDTLPDCDGAGSGTGGNTGSSGSGGSGGSATGSGGSAGAGSGGTAGSGSDASAAAGCEACTKADACCTAFSQGFDAGACEMTADDCNAATGADRAQIVQACLAILMNFSQFPAAPAACK